MDNNLLTEIGRLLIESEIEGFKAVTRAISQAKADWLKFGPAYEDDFRHKNQPSRPRTRRHSN